MKRIIFGLISIMFFVSCENTMLEIPVIDNVIIEFTNNSQFEIHVIEYEGNTFSEFTILPMEILLIDSVCAPYYFKYCYDNNIVYYDFINYPDYGNTEQVQIKTTITVNKCFVEFYETSADIKIIHGQQWYDLRGKK